MKAKRTQQAEAYTPNQLRALGLLARGGARYGTMIDTMQELKAMGLCYSHDRGGSGPGRWTWRPTKKGVQAIGELEWQT